VTATFAVLTAILNLTPLRLEDVLHDVEARAPAVRVQRRKSTSPVRESAPPAPGMTRSSP
jgi:hypothetical protein